MEADSSLHISASLKDWLLLQTIQQGQTNLHFISISESRYLL